MATYCTVAGEPLPHRADSRAVIGGSVAATDGSRGVITGHHGVWLGARGWTTGCQLSPGPTLRVWVGAIAAGAWPLSVTLALSPRVRPRLRGPTSDPP